MTVIIFLAVLSVLVFVHELGHFLTARWMGMKVEEFSIGFRPALYEKRVGETNYVIGAIPLGGYVKILGENQDDEDCGTEPSNREFGARPLWAQAVVLVAGVTMNVLLAWMILVGLAFGNIEVVGSQFPDKTLVNSRVEVFSVLPKSPAHEAGIKVGDTIVSVGEEMEAIAMREKVALSGGEGVVVAWLSKSDNESNGKSEGKTEVLNTMPYEGKQIVGLVFDDVGTVRLGAAEALRYGSIQTYEYTKAIAVGAYSFLASAVMFDADVKELSGPVGIARVVGEAAENSMRELLFFMALLSLNLAVLNMLPIPALDGGRLVFVAYEAVTRKRVPKKVFNIMNTAGMALLILLMLVVTVGDIGRLF